MIKLRFILFSITLCALKISACNTDTSVVTRIIVDFPHGALRLHVQRDGDTHLFYGASPTNRPVQRNTFDIDDLFQQLQSRLHDNVPAENRPIGQPYGMVTIEFSDSSKRDYLIYDENFAVRLIKIACANLAHDEEFSGEIVNAACAKVGSAIP